MTGFRGCYYWQQMFEQIEKRKRENKVFKYRGGGGSREREKYLFFLLSRK